MKICDCTVAIIAGGRSKRFGSPKYKAKIDGLRLMDIALQLAQKLSEKILVISWIEALKEELPFPVVDDLFPGHGPLAGIHSALHHCKTDWIAILPVDMPLLTTDVYARLSEQRKGQTPVVAQTAKGVEPMVSFWHKANLPVIERQLKKKELVIHQTLGLLNAQRVEFPPEQQMRFFNVNFPDDLKVIRQQHEGVQQ